MSGKGPGEVLWHENPVAEGLPGPKVIAEAVATLPNAPGVYRMIRSDGDVLYVGKARSLKKRVSSYTRIGGQNQRIARMIHATAAMDFVRTKTETEALLLEANLIKRLRPRYNVLLRDDKSFPYILVSADHEAPAIFKHRGARKRKGRYYGPFASAGAVGRTINTLQKAFLIRNCTDAFYASRTRPCLLFQIKRCAAPCTGEISMDEYAKLAAEAHAFLSGKSRAVMADLAAAMEQAADKLDFETAAICRDRLAALSHIQSRQDVNTSSVDEADLFAIHQDGGQTCIQVFFFRTGQNWGNRAYYPRADRSLEPAPVLEAFMAQFYDGKPVPRQILASVDFPERSLLAQAFSERAGYKVRVDVPQRGARKALIDQALANAREALGRKMSDTATQTSLLKGLAETLELSAPPARIEVYDNSHVSGTNAVGGMIVSGPAGFSKTHYRKFNIKSADIAAGDDYAMMREVLHRRFSRLLKEMGPKPESEIEADTPATDASEEAVPAWPDLVLVDGGKGQLSVAMAVLAELQITGLPVFAIAKGRDRDAGREQFISPGRKPFTLPPRDPVLYFVQRLRDEAHRFAIGAHRARRKAGIAKNPLDEIAGIGPSRKKALLRMFGTAKAVSRAGVEDLMDVEGISRATAELIYDHFHEHSS